METRVQELRNKGDVRVLKHLGEDCPLERFRLGKDDEGTENACTTEGQHTNEGWTEHICQKTCKNKTKVIEN